MVPWGARPCKIQKARLRTGVAERRKRVWRGVGGTLLGVASLLTPAFAAGRGRASACGWRWLIISDTLLGFDERVMVVVVPAAVANRAATILVAMPPVPRVDPAEDTSASRESMSGTISMGCASGNFRGFLL